MKAHLRGFKAQGQSAWIRVRRPQVDEDDRAAKGHAQIVEDQVARQQKPDLAEQYREVQLLRDLVKHFEQIERKHLAEAMWPGPLGTLACQLQFSADQARCPRRLSQHGSIVMSILSQIRSVGRQRNNIDRTPSIETLATALRKTELALLESIAAEEERIRLRGPDDPHYSTLARSMRRRLDNLRKTIATLEAAALRW
jgi:hypothetical protein